MGGKHLKKLRAEKAKVQLKKKKLLKGQNITDTSFKVKKILVVEQLKKAEDNEPVSNWKVTLKDLLTRLSHHNCTTRLNSLTGIKEILTKSPEILLGPSLKLLITRLLEQLMDEERKVRITAMNLISHIFGLLPQEMRIPFYDISIAYLSCAMTHRDAAIQKDSLKFVDIMVQHYPGAFRQKIQMLMPNFLRILKTFLYGSQTDELPSKGPKPELEKSKTKMLVRFYYFLAACYSDDESITESCLINRDINVLAKQKISLRETCDLYKTIPDLSGVFKNSEGKEKVIKESNSEDLRSLCSSVMPLLFDIWTEFSPNPRMDMVSSECVLTEAVGNLLSVLLKIMLLLYEKIMAMQDPEMGNWFVSTYSQAFKKSFTANFPYFPSVVRKRSRSSDQMDTPRETLHICVEQNLIICYLSYSFKLVCTSDLQTKIEDYISHMLRKKNPSEVDILSKVVEAAVNASKSTESKVLNMAVAAHRRTMSPGLQQSLSKVLTKVALEESENLSPMGENFENWVVHLPRLLSQPKIYLHEVEAILKLIIKPSGAEVLQGVEFRANEIAKNLPSIRVEGVARLEGQRMIANILYRCDEIILEEIIRKQIIKNSPYSESLKDYVLEIFYQKLGRQLDVFKN